MIDHFGFIIDGAKLRQTLSEIYNHVSVTALHIVAELTTAAITNSYNFRAESLEGLMPTSEPPSPRLFVPL